MVEFEETINRNADIMADTNTTTSDEVKKRVSGVTKYKNKWRARIQHSKLKFEVHVGLYNTPEEAALAIKKKKAEYEEKMFQCGENTDFEGKKLPSGVCRKTYRTWGARIRHPKLKRDVSLGSYGSVEEAAMAVKNKKAEFCNMYMAEDEKLPTKFFEPENSNITDVSEDVNVRSFYKAKAEFSKKMDRTNSDKDRMCVSGVTKCGNKWRARFRHPKLKADVHVGIYSSPEEAALALKKKKSEYEEKMFKGGENKAKHLDSDILNIVKDEKLPTMRFKPQNSNNGNFCHKIESRIENLDDTLNIAEDEKLPTKFSELENSNITDYTFGFDKTMNLDSDILNIVKDEKLPTMVFKPKNLNIGSRFDEGMSLGIVNEYGQLLGMYSELDEMMELDLPDEHDAHLGHFRCSL